MQWSTRLQSVWWWLSRHLLRKAKFTIERHCWITLTRFKLVTAVTWLNRHTHGKQFYSTFSSKKKTQNKTCLSTYILKSPISFYTITECTSHYTDISINVAFFSNHLSWSHELTTKCCFLLSTKFLCAECSSSSSSGLPLLQHLQVHAERLLDGLLGDEVDKMLDVGLPAG